MHQWEEIVQLASTLTLTNDSDELIWTFNRNGVYSSQSLYKIINFRGIQSIYLPAIWDMKIPPRMHFFLWLLSQNKIMTRDNVAKRKKVEDKRCLFCTKEETPHHLFFGCVVASQIWCNVLKC
jgi:hypothetical protein